MPIYKLLPFTGIALVSIFCLTESFAQNQNSSILVGQWHMAFQDSQGNGDLYIEYSSNGEFRGIIYTPNEATTIVQTFGTYMASQDAQGNVRVQRQILRRLPTLLCRPNDGNCQQVPFGPAQVSAQFVIARDGSLIDSSNRALRREPIPVALLHVIPERLYLHQVPRVVAQSPNSPSRASTPGSSAIAGPTHMAPFKEHGNGGECDDLQQQRLCTVNNGHMYKDKNGCQVCAGPN